jgi:hypothetical protein
MSLVFLAAALGLVTISLTEATQHAAISVQPFFSAKAKSWLGFFILLGLAVCSFTASIVHPEQIVIPYG